MSLTITAKFTADLRCGDSVCVNGICLTVAEKKRDAFRSDVVGETMERSSLRYLRVGDLVNLERAMPASGRFDGHIVLGHADCRAMITGITGSGAGREMEINAPDDFRKYLAEKGSIAVDGVSLTVASLARTSFKVAIIPHTALNTNLFHKKTGDWVNLEFDVLAKYLESLVEKKDINSLLSLKDASIDEEFLKKAGFLN